MSQKHAQAHMDLYSVSSFSGKVNNSLQKEKNREQILFLDAGTKDAMAKDPGGGLETRTR